MTSMGYSHTHSHGKKVFEGQRRALIIAFVINFVFLIVEVVGGFISNSLALLADAGHMLTDVMALGISLFALNLSRKPPTPQKTYGFKRAEIIAAFVNGLTLWIMVVFIAYESFDRFLNPPEIKMAEMLIIAVLGLLANLGSGLVVLSHVRDNINIKGAFLHLMSDALGSVGVIVGAVAMIFTGWTVIDPIVSILIGILIIVSSVDLLKESINILMQGTPPELDLLSLKKEIESLSGVKNVHDMHAWALSRGHNALSAHVLVEEGVKQEELLREIVDIITTKYPVHHVTIQIETSNIQPVICTECGAPI